MHQRDELVGPDYDISTDRGRLDRELVFRFLSEEAYWSRGIDRARVERAIDSSLCFGAYSSGEQAGFARVVTDGATFAYLCDVFVMPQHRGQGLGKRLVRAVLEHPDVRGLRRVILVTEDAHELYRRFGFGELRKPEMYLALELSPGSG